ncbi:PEGA domain-containing protein [Candidatus Saccharibacteria bacterium]|nr:PEGA domain-containing protein [Candidatus Saccharibacteria bacterium]
MPERHELFSFKSNNKQKKIVRLTGVILVVAFIGVIIYSIINLIVNHDKTATIEILVAPSDATVLIDGKSYSTDTKIKIKPGTYAVKIEKDGFISFNGTIKANMNETSFLYEYLNEVDENGTYYKDNEKELLRTQHISDKKADLFHENYTGTDEIWNVTPYDDYASGYKIYAEKEESSDLPLASGTSNSNTTVINVYLYTCDNDKVEKLKGKALEYLEEKKINLKNYTVKYSFCE